MEAKHSSTPDGSESQPATVAMNQPPYLHLRMPSNQPGGMPPYYSIPPNMMMSNMMMFNGGEGPPGLAHTHPGPMNHGFMGPIGPLGPMASGYHSYPPGMYPHHFMPQYSPWPNQHPPMRLFIYFVHIVCIITNIIK
jgi:hypothetical protein